MSAMNLAEAKAHLSELVTKAESGEETIIMRRGQAVAKLVPVAGLKRTLSSRADFRASLAKTSKPTVALIRAIRDEGY